MFINDLEYLEVVQNEDLVQGGLQQVSVASSSASGISDTGSININANSNSNTSSGFSGFFFSGPSTSAFGNASASTSPLPPRFPIFFPF